MTRRDQSGGRPWREDLPERWGDVLDHPPLATGVDDEVDVLDHGSVTVFRDQDSATRWLQADDQLVVDVDEAR